MNGNGNGNGRDVVRHMNNEKPIIFTGESVRAILDGKKTQTRRVIKDQPCNRAVAAEPVLHGPTWWFFNRHNRNGKHNGGSVVNTITCPFKVGQQLWVKETWVELLHTSPATDEPVLSEGDKLLEHATVREVTPDGRKIWRYDGRVISYRATSDVEFCDGDGFTEYANKDDLPKWKSPLFMRREHSRIDLVVTKVKAERVQSISKDDVLAEGCEYFDPPAHPYMEMWDSINGKKHPWSSNPWVWVIEFKKL